MAHFFIDRPIFAWVIALLLMLAGVISIKSLPVAQYPAIAPPTITITATYPGASAKTVEDSVTQVVEQHMKGLDNLEYMYSTSDAMGQGTITLSFSNGTDPDIAQVQVQNKLQLATPLLPESVQRQGIAVSKSSHNFLLVAAFVSNDSSMSAEDLNDYVVSNIEDPVSRIAGVGDLQLFGAQYAMRIWCDPSMFQKYSLSPNDVITAIQAQNNDVSAGQLGGAPSVPGQMINITVNSQSRLENVEQFKNIILKALPDGSAVYLRDIAKIELGGESYYSFTRYNGKEASGMGIKLASGANALDTVATIKAELDTLSNFFPTGMSVEYSYDTTPFVSISIREVVKTLIEAVALVFALMFLFLQNFRATLVPTIAVPVVLLGTFAVMSAAGFSINTLTMFGMVLAIGLLVDDAIVVVENVERVMEEEGLSPKEATKKSMNQITGALVGIAMVLSAVFIPMAFFGGSAGVIYRQFSITIVAAMVLSVLVAIILTPALCATMLKPKTAHNEKKTKHGFFDKFNQLFEKATKGYQNKVASILKRQFRFLLIYAGLVAGLVFMFLRLPTGFLPDEDQGILMCMVQMPPGASFERTQSALGDVEKYFMEKEKDTVKSIMTVSGFSFSGNGQNNGMGFISLKDWEERNGDTAKAKAIAERANRYLYTANRDATIFVFPPPAVIELGTASGFDFELIDRAGLGHDALMQQRNRLLAMTQMPENSSMMRNVRPYGLEDTTQFNLDIDFEKAATQSVYLSQIANTISAFWGSAYINDFMDKGRIKKVYLQADAPYRMSPEDFNRIYIPNAFGDMVPFSSIGTGKWAQGSPRLERFNGVSSLEIVGEAAPGKTTGQAMQRMEELVKQLQVEQPGIGYEWTNLSREEVASSGQATSLYAISMIVVFLCLAALYESWSIPVAVLLVVPLGVLGAIGAATLRGFSNDVYFQVGLLTIIGLSAKNAILIVEFAKELHENGKNLIDATLEAVRLRLRPIIMTSMAFILGVTPLAISTGAGSGSQNDIGTGVIGGMITATLLGIFFIPLFFVVVSRLFSKKQPPAATGQHNDAEKEVYNA